jgi:MarR family transcriptional regulator, organic hydroperoxide resistance regulator
MAAKDYDLRNYLPYLVNRAGSRLVDAFTKELAPFGLTIAQWRILSALWHDGPMRLGALAAHTSIEVSTLSRSVATMARKELLTRTRSDPDARAVQVGLTKAGRRVTERLIPIALAYEAAAIAGFSPEETAALRRLLRRLYANMESPVLAAAAKKSGGRGVG